jgi:SEC-C motif
LGHGVFLNRAASRFALHRFVNRAASPFLYLFFTVPVSLRTSRCRGPGCMYQGPQANETANLNRLREKGEGCMTSVGHSRNSPCPCGSGKKYKRCCAPRTDSRIAARTALEGSGPETQAVGNRNDRARIIFFICISGLVCLVGLTSAVKVERLPWPATASAVLKFLYGVGGFAGVIGLFAVLCGSRRWSRVAYLFALAFPIGTFLTIFVHEHRIRRLAASAMPGRGDQKIAMKCPKCVCEATCVVLDSSSQDSAERESRSVANEYGRYTWRNTIFGWINTILLTIAVVRGIYRAVLADNAMIYRCSSCGYQWKE